MACLPLTTPSTTVTTTASSTALTTTIETQNVLATETTTNTVTSTWYTTSIPTLTTIVTPTTTLTPAPVTSTPVSTATVTETKTVHVGQAAVQLTNPTPIITAASRSYDDTTGLRINNIPFDVGLYGVTSRTLIIGINGWVSPGTTDSGTYVNEPLPNAAAGDPSWVAYWADLYVTQGTTQGIYYQIDGDEGSRTLSIEYFMSFYGASVCAFSSLVPFMKFIYTNEIFLQSAYTHFMVTLFEEEVGRVVFSYFQTTSTKASTNSAYGTIGVQRPATGQYNQYSYNVQPQEGLTIEWRPSTNQWTQVSSGTC
ncbi:hypothetical protein SLS60_011108 [Paraconiothyrium brasiliense]|uniref:Uncharacterized protein n=1 Tax=Paraconiothyrium brasiliense TaxID=300254 RepID=A0ABR3QLH0_9PLEO